MAESYGPFDNAAFGESDWSRMTRLFAPNGVSGATDLAVSSALLVATIAAGEGFVQGFWYRSTAGINKTIGANNSAGTTRYDLVVLRSDPANNQVVTDVLIGTPSASPVDPTLTQIQGGVWEIPLARCAVVAAATTMTVTDLRTRSGNYAAVAVLKQTVAQSLPDNTWTPITFTAEVVDTDGGHSTSVNTSRYTAQVAGWYFATGIVWFASNSTGTRHATLSVNNFRSHKHRVPAFSGGSVDAATSALLYLNVGDYLELQGIQNAGGALLTVSADDEERCWLELRYVSP